MTSDLEPGDDGSDKKEGPPRGGDAWKEQTKGIERIIDVTLALQEPRTAGWIADEAMVSEQTARDHLDTLADLGVISATTARGVTKYQPDVAFLRYKQVSGLIERMGKEELMDQVEDLQKRIEEVKETYGAETPDELRSKATEQDTSPEEVQEYRKVASEWESVRHNLDTFKEAIDRYEEFGRATASSA